MAWWDITNKDSVTKIRDYYKTYLLTPSLKFGLAGFIFDIEGEQSINLQSEITDHYVENNTAVQDHIATKPLRITLKNYVGELIYEDGFDLFKETTKVVAVLGSVASYLPEITTQSKQLFTKAYKNNLSFTQTVEDTSDLWANIKNFNPMATRQQKAYLFLESLWQQKVLFSLQTPFKFVQDLAIESMVSTQGEDSEHISDFQITLKQIRTADLQFTSYKKGKYQSRSDSQRQPQQNNGKSKGELVKQPSLAIQLTR